MPNQDNITSPITLISLGRSGTSLVSNIFDSHPDCRSFGETMALIFGTWHAVEFSAVGTPTLFEDDIRVSDEERAARVVRQALLTCFPDDRPRWFHKPIDIPRILFDKFDNDQWSEAAAWYWKVMKHTFPNAKFFTVLRNPCDIVLSNQSRWGPPPVQMWRMLGLMASLLMHPASPVEYAVHFEELVQHKEKVVEDLFSYVELPFDKQVLTAFTRVHAPSPGRERLDQISTTRDNEWNSLDASVVQLADINYLTQLFNKFGYDLPLPPHFTEDALAVKKKSKKGGLEQRIAKLEKEAVEFRHYHREKIQKLNINRQHWQGLAQKRQAQSDYWQGLAKEKDFRLQQLETMLDDIHQTRSWKFVQKYWSLKEKLLKVFP